VTTLSLSTHSGTSANRISVLNFLVNGLVLVVYIIDHQEF